MENKSILKNDLTYLIKKQDEYNELSERLQGLRAEKNELEVKILTFLHEKQWNDKVFIFDEYKISQKSSYQYQQMSLKYIEETLRHYISANNISMNVEHFLEYIKQNRSKKQKNELKLS